MKLASILILSILPTGVLAQGSTFRPLAGDSNPLNYSKTYPDILKPGTCKAILAGMVTENAEAWIESNEGSGTLRYGYGVHKGNFATVIDNLKPNTTYHYRLGAINPNTGAIFRGATLMVKTGSCQVT